MHSLMPLVFQGTQPGKSQTWACLTKPRGSPEQLTLAAKDRPASKWVSKGWEWIYEESQCIFFNVLLSTLTCHSFTWWTSLPPNKQTPVFLTRAANPPALIFSPQIQWKTFSLQSDTNLILSFLLSDLISALFLMHFQSSSLFCCLSLSLSPRSLPSILEHAPLFSILMNSHCILLQTFPKQL